MNAIELQTAIQDRLRAIENSRRPPTNEKTRWVKPLMVAGAGVACLATAASMTAATVPTLASGLAAVAGGTVGLLAGLKIGGVGVAVMGTALAIPVSAVATLTASVGAIAAGGAVWLGYLSHPTITSLAVAFHWVGILLLAGVVIYAAVQYGREICKRPAMPCAA